MTRVTLQVPVEYLPTTPERTPLFLPLLCNFLKERCKTPGIFRVNGNQETIKQLNVSLSQHVPRLVDNADVHDAAGFLKKWLFSLPVPLIPPDIYNQYFKPNDSKSVNELLEKLQLVSRRSLASIFSVIKCVLKESDENLMTFSNLATCFVPALTQNSPQYKIPFMFEMIYNTSIAMFNEDETDFVLAETQACLLTPECKARARVSSRKVKAFARQNITLYSPDEFISVPTAS